MKDILLLEKIYTEQALPDRIAGYRVINKGGKRVIEGTVMQDKKKLTKLPDFSSVDLVEGDFTCNFNKLTSLEGCPRSIGGSLYCFANRLVTLKGCPRYIGKHFNFEDNKVPSFEGCAKIVGGTIVCTNNLLISLKGCPISISDPGSISDSFYGAGNRVVSLEGCPQTIPGDFVCGIDRTASLKGFPVNISGKCYIGENEYELPTERFDRNDLSNNISKIINSPKLLNVYKDIHVPVTDDIFEKYIIPNRYKAYWTVLESELSPTDKGEVINHFKLKVNTEPTETLDL